MSPEICTNGNLLPFYAIIYTQSSEASLLPCGFILPFLAGTFSQANSLELEKDWPHFLKKIEPGNFPNLNARVISKRGERCTLLANLEILPLLEQWFLIKSDGIPRCNYTEFYFIRNYIGFWIYPFFGKRCSEFQTIDLQAHFWITV